MPRVALHGAPGVGLPQPLSPSEAARDRRIFALQASGNISEASRETDQLDSRLLLGPILAARYLGGWVQPTAAELTDWLAAYGDQSDAPAIRALRAHLVPDTRAIADTADTRAIAATGPGAATGPTIPAQRRAAPASPARVRTLFVANHDTAAVAAAAPLLSHPSLRNAEPLFSAGLAAWRLGDMPTATQFFDTAYRASPGADHLHAAAAFWTARTAQRQGDRASYVVWMRRAAQESNTFYGRIAGRALGPSLTCLAGGGLLGTADIDALAATPQGRLGFALLQVGETRRAEAEFRALWDDSRQNPILLRPLASLARSVGMPVFAADLRYATLPAPGPPAPPPLHPAGGFVIDPALIYALVHHESNFHPAAVSNAGARGLMQIKPATARGVSGLSAADHLHDPAVNLAVGQRYLLQLSGDDAIDGDLIRLLAAYAQGLSAARQWADGVNGQGDPLLFIEAIPNPGTRAFVQDVLAWSWHYAATFRLPPTSLEALAAGHFPQLVQTDDEARAPGPDCNTAVAAR